MNQRNSVLVTRYMIEGSVEQVGNDARLVLWRFLFNNPLGNALATEEKTDDRGNWQWRHLINVPNT